MLTGRVNDAEQPQPQLRQSEGMLSADNQILGTYMHGLFDSPAGCQLLLQWAGMQDANSIDVDQIREQQLNRLADVLEQHLDVDALTDIWH